MKSKGVFSLLIIALCLFFSAPLSAQRIELLQRGPATSIRGLSVVDDSVAWLSGSNGEVAVTKDGGKTWDWQQVKGFEKSDLRDIEAFSGQTAIIMSSGTPAVILKTTDGGKSWQTKYKNTDTAYFFDAMDFENRKHGMVLGDPINGKFILMETKDGGNTWLPFKNPPGALRGEACFAASGTCLRLNGMITIVTGGTHSRMLLSPAGTGLWAAVDDLHMTKGSPSQGAFSVVYGDDKIIVAGGDYSHDRNADNIIYMLPQSGADYQGEAPQKGPSGYQSCVEYLGNETFLSTGTPGSYISADGGKTWHKIDDPSYNVCARAKRGNLVLLAGENGRVGILNYNSLAVRGLRGR